MKQKDSVNKPFRPIFLKSAIYLLQNRYRSMNYTQHNNKLKATMGLTTWQKPSTLNKMFL